MASGMAEPTIDPASEAQPLDQPIVFYDGACGLCDRFVQFVLRHDRDGRFRFAPLQGETFAAYRPRVDAADLSTMVLVDEAGLHTRSTAALRVVRSLGGLWGPIGRLGLLLPRPLRDLGYRAVARVRHRLFPPPSSCRRPDPAHRPRFLP
jgi:predicted DCC family thiol-disulfide oxidoreductase YuxK